MIDIRAGISNDEIGQKYGLSEKGIRSLFDKLVGANLVTAEELYYRLGSAPKIRGESMDEREAAVNTAPATNPREFIDISGQGRNQWYRYVAGILFTTILPTVIMIIITAFLPPNWRLDDKTGSYIGIDPIYNYILLNFWFLLLFAAIFLTVRREHKRRFLSLITPNQSVDWKKIGKSFGIWFGLLACVLVLDYIMAPEEFEFVFNPSRFLWFAPTVLVLTPIQTTTEELFCRGYLLQMMALLTWNRILLVAISGLLFMLPHLANPEVALGFWTMTTYYFAMGAFLTLVTLRSNGLEVAIGIHAATNLFSGVVVNYVNSPLKTESILLHSAFDPLGSLIGFCIIAVVFYFLFFGGKLTLRKPWST